MKMKILILLLSIVFTLQADCGAGTFTKNSGTFTTLAASEAVTAVDQAACHLIHASCGFRVAAGEAAAECCCLKSRGRKKMRKF